MQDRQSIREQGTLRGRLGILSYDLDVKFTFTSLRGRTVPDRLVADVEAVFQKACQELDDQIAELLDDREGEPRSNAPHP
jgi:hypothetical protein